MFTRKKARRSSREQTPYILAVPLTMQEVMQDLDPGWFAPNAESDPMEVA